QIAEVVVARPDLDPRVRDADERLAQVVVGEADGLQHRARRRARGTRGDHAARRTGRVLRPAPFVTVGLGSAGDETARGALYVPSVRTQRANSARFTSARPQFTSSRETARSA